VYYVHRTGYAPAGNANRESGNLDDSPPASPAADETGLDHHQRLEPSISHVSGNGDLS